MLGLKSGIITPSMIESCEYLQTGGAQIDTGCMPNQDYIVECKAVGTGTIFGCVDSSNRYYGIVDIGTWGYFDYMTRYKVLNWANDIKVYRVEKNVFSVDGAVIKTADEAAFTIGRTMFIGARIGANQEYVSEQATYSTFRGSIYYCKIWEGDTLLRNFTPALIKGKYGFWDSVTRRFYTSANPDADFSGPSE